MTAAAELRQAAAKVREKAKALTDAGAETDWPNDWREFFTLHGADLCLVREDEEWIALMSPALAEPIAAMLDDAADQIGRHGFTRPDSRREEYDFHDGSDRQPGCNRIIGGGGDHRCDCFDHALTLARAINGGAS